jgi:protein ImuB
MLILLITTTSNQQRIAHCCEHSAAAGVTPGMSLSHARALLPLEGVVIEDQNPEREALDVTGCQRLHRGERRLLNAVANSIEWLGFHVRIACASNFICARAVARYGARTPSPPLTPTLSRPPQAVRPSPAGTEGDCGHVDRFIVPAGDELDALRDLPIEGLRLEQETIDALHEINIDRIGHLTCLPRSDLATRFGRDPLVRLDRALGDPAGADETIEPQRPIETPRVERIFDGPVKQVEGIARTVQELVSELSEHLRRLESGVQRLDIDFERIDAANLRETIMLSRPSRDAKHLWSLMRPRIEKVNLGFGVEKIVLSAMRTGRLPHAQVERGPMTMSASPQLNRRRGSSSTRWPIVWAASASPA